MWKENNQFHIVLRQFRCHHVLKNCEFGEKYRLSDDKNRREPTNNF